jgi:predicted phage baseplate assembly protein
MTIIGEDLGTVPYSNPVLTKVSVSKDNRCKEEPASLTPPRFGPQLKEKPVTQAASYDPVAPPASARSAMSRSIRSVLPSIALKEQGVSGHWEPKRDLLNSSPNDKEFVVEIENNGLATIRFGDDQNGSRPASGSTFKASYRVGNGVSGNISADTLAHIISDDPAIIGDSVITEVLNPLPAHGGTEPESIEQVRQNAPSALQINERAVIPADYEEIVQRCNLNVQRAAATFRWTGSWHTVFLTVDRLGGKEVDADYERDMRRCVERYRMAGYDLEVDGPRYVFLEIEMTVCVQSNYFRSDMESALLELFSNQTLPDGRKGVFHPDNFTFGQTVYPSPLYAAAQAMEGVASVEITRFQRQNASDEEAAESLKKGKIELGRLEIARLDNDPNFPERGIFSFDMKGGR